MTSPSPPISFLRSPVIVIYIEALYSGLQVKNCSFVESLISVPGQKTKILPDIRLLSKVFNCQDFLNRRIKPESKALPEMLVQYKGALKEMNNLDLRFFWSPEFKNLTSPTLMTSKGNWGANGSNSINSTNIYRALIGQALYMHQAYEIQLDYVSGFMEPSGC